jgi:hypothetical protein
MESKSIHFGHTVLSIAMHKSLNQSNLSDNYRKLLHSSVSKMVGLIAVLHDDGIPHPIVMKWYMANEE